MKKQLDKKTFHKTGYFQIGFLCLFIFFIILGFWGFFYEDDMPVVGFIWAGFVAMIYWLIKLGKFKIGITLGFVFGVLIDFLFLFALHKINPEEDIAGIVIISLLLSGLLFALIGYLIQKYFAKTYFLNL